MEDRMQGSFARAQSFWLFEATGDSELDGRDPGHGEVPMEEDDAESCSYDTSDWTNADDVGEYDATAWLGDGHEEEEEEDEDEDEDEFEDKQSSRAQLPGEEYKSCVSVESTNELMNEMERSKLFWEACLAS